MEERLAHCLGDIYELSREFAPIGGGMGWSYRGQADAKWPLIPKAGRPEYFDPNWNRKMIGLPPKDLGRFRAWRNKAIAFSSELPDNDFECLAFAQHHGLATRLLDWTENPHVALYFGVRDLAERDGAIYAYFNGVFVDTEKMRLEDLDRIALFVPRPVRQRILVQRAFFTVHPEPQIPLASEEIPDSMRRFTDAKHNLVRIRIPAEAKPVIQSELDHVGINHFALFPGIDGLSEFINWETRRGVTASLSPAASPEDEQ